MNTITRPRGAPSWRIDPFDLRLFSAVVEAGSITAGAAEAALSLAAASTRLQNLEHALGAQLLRRSKRGVALTDAGHTLLRHAGRLQREMEALHAEMAAHAHGVRSTVRLLCNTAAMTEHLPPRLGPFLAAHPEIDVELREMGSQEVLRALRAEQADLGIVANHMDTEGLATRPFCPDRLVALLPATSNRPPARRALRFADLLQRPFVGLPADSGLSRLLQHQALQHGRGLHHRVRVRSVDAVVALVASGAGVAVVPEAAALRLPDARVLVRGLADAWAQRQLRLCCIDEQALGAGARRLLEHLGAG